MQRKRRLWHKILYLALTFSFIFQQIGFAQGALELNLSGYLARMQSSMTIDKFRPMHLRYFNYDINSHNFKILLDKGDLKNPAAGELENSSKELLNYFLVGLTLNNESFWVNLRPDSQDQIIDNYLVQTDVGRIMLETDLQLKKDTAKLTSPETPEGREYWNKLYKKAEEIYGYENITIPTLTRPWIVPGEIIIHETDSSAYIYKATLKVMLESDYLANSTNSTIATNATYEFKDSRSKALNEYSTQLIKELIIPKLTKEVNTSKRYANIRQVYYSLILSRWFKNKFAGQTGGYASRINTQDLTGLTSKEPWSKTTYFKEYQKSFKEGEYNLKEPVYTPTGQVIRSYFSGGITTVVMGLDGIEARTGVRPNTKTVYELGGSALNKELVSSPPSAGSPITESEKAKDASEITKLKTEREKLRAILKQSTDTDAIKVSAHRIQTIDTELQLLGDEQKGAAGSPLTAEQQRIAEAAGKILSNLNTSYLDPSDGVDIFRFRVVEAFKVGDNQVEGKLWPLAHPLILFTDVFKRRLKTDLVLREARGYWIYELDHILDELKATLEEIRETGVIPTASLPIQNEIRVAEKLKELRKNSGLPISTTLPTYPVEASDNALWSKALGVLHFDEDVYRRVESDIKNEKGETIGGEIITGELDDENNKDSQINKLRRQYDVRTGDFKSIRLGSGVKDFIENENAQVTPEAYFMHRGVFASTEDILKAFYGENKLRFDITIIPPALWGREYAKTIGHYRFPVEFPEIYQVVSGEALWIMQKCKIDEVAVEKETAKGLKEGKTEKEAREEAIKKELDRGEIEKFVVVKAKAGDIVIMLPGYGHVSVNISETEPLIMADWLTWHQKSYYGSFGKNRGAAFYAIKNDKGELELAINTEYVKNVKPEDIQQKVPKDGIPVFGLKRGEPIYNLVKLNNKDFTQKTRFLYYPNENKYKELLTVKETLDDAKEEEKIKISAGSPLLLKDDSIFSGKLSNLIELSRNKSYDQVISEGEEILRRYKDFTGFENLFQLVRVRNLVGEALIKRGWPGDYSLSVYRLAFNQKVLQDLKGMDSELLSKETKKNNYLINYVFGLIEFNDNPARALMFFRGAHKVTPGLEATWRALGILRTGFEVLKELGALNKNQIQSAESKLQGMKFILYDVPSQNPQVQEFKKYIKEASTYLRRIKTQNVSASSAVQPSLFSSTELRDLASNLFLQNVIKHNANSKTYYLSERFRIFIRFAPEEDKTYLSLASVEFRNLTRSSTGDWRTATPADILKKLAEIVKEEEKATVSSEEAGERVSSPILQENKAGVGGIDFRALPMTIKPMGSFEGLNLKLPQLTPEALAGFNLSQEIEELNNMISGGIIPSGARVQELVAAAWQKGRLQDYQTEILTLLAEICKLQEGECCESSDEFKVALVAVNAV